MALIAKVRRLQRMQETLRQARLPPRERFSDVGLLDFIPRISPLRQAPYHLGRLVELLERSEYEPVYGYCTVPPRHGKTETVLHAIARFLARHPDETNIYASYSADIARSKSRLARDYAMRAGVALRDDSKALGEWRTPQGGGLLATGIGGALTGHGARRAIVDDPHKNRAEAESRVIRDNVYEWFTSTVLSRIEPGGSAFVVHTRWHDDDLIGRLSRDTETTWEGVDLPAIDGGGNALWPERWPVGVLEERRKRVGEYDWASLYMGTPRPRGAGLFESAHLVDTLPDGPMRFGIGLDFAYTSSSKADHSVAVVLGELAGTLYVVEVVRRQCSAPAFANELRKLAGRYPGARMFAFVGGTEKGVVDMLNAQRVDGEPPLRIVTAPAVTDKFVRAQACAADWNAGKIACPKHMRGVNEFVDELVAFPTGVHDDQVDALVNAHHLAHKLRAPEFNAHAHANMPKAR